MTSLIRIESADDDRLRDYVGLTDVVLRTRLEPAAGLYLAESEKVIRRALAAGHRPRSLLLTDRWLAPLADLVRRVADTGAPIYTGPEELLAEVTGFHVHRGAIAAMHRPVLPPVAELLAEARRVLVLEDVVDHTNVGAIVRSAAGLGADAVLITPRCADPLYRRAVRVSMGTVFQVPWTRIPAWPAGIRELRAAGLMVAALSPTAGAIDLDAWAATRPERVALLLGTEGDGLSPAAVGEADLVVRIPMAGGVDSLNVAAATAVVLWALRHGAG